MILYNFYPRSPRGERLADRSRGSMFSLFLSTLPARGATDASASRGVPNKGFLSTLPARGATFTFSSSTGTRFAFLSTLPARGATFSALYYTIRNTHFYPRSPRGERRERVSADLCRVGISIHAPREGSDLPPPAGKRHKPISIHAPREGSDAAA